MAIVLSGYGSRYIDCRRTVYTHHHRRRLHIHHPHHHQPHHRHCNPHLNHHRHHPRKHVVLLLFGRATVGATGTRSNAVYDYIMRVERKLSAFSGYIWLTCQYCLIAQDTSWCKEYCPHFYGRYRYVGNEIGRRFQRRTSAVSRNAAAYEYSNQFSAISNGAVLQF